MTNSMAVLPKYISLLVGLWELLFKIEILVSRLKLSRDSGFSSKIETIPPNSGRLDTLQGFLGGPGAYSPGKKLDIWGLQTAGNALKLSILPSPGYFCIILNILRSHQAVLFGSWGGGGGARAPRAPPCLRTCLIFITWCSSQYNTIRFNHESAIFSWILHLIEVLRAEIPNGRPWQKTNLMNIAPDRGSAWWIRKWRAMTKD